MQEPKTNDLVEVREKIDGMQKMLDKTQVTTDAELESVADKIKGIKTLAKFIKLKKDKFTAPAKEIIAEAKVTYDPFLKQCESAELNLKDKARKYMLEKEAERKKAEEKIAARVEKGTMRTDTAMKKIEAMPEVANTVKTDIGSKLRMAKRKVARISDPNLVPKEYWIIDEVRIRRDAIMRDKMGQPPIPGTVIEEVADLSSI